MGAEAESIVKNLKKFLNTHSIVFVFIILICFMKFLHSGCLIKYITGIPCPGCGLTRATLAFLRFDIKSAFHYHPLFWLATPLLLISIYAKRPLFNSKKIEMIVYTVVGFLFIGVYIYRMITLFPNGRPMTINNNSIFLTNLKIIKSFLFHSI